MIKNLKRRILSLALSLALAVGSLVLPFGVFATEPPPVDSLLLLNRDFEDRTAVTNGFNPTQTAGNEISLKTEDGNTYMHWVYNSTNTDTKHGHFNINISNYLPDEGSVVMRFRVRTESVSSTKRNVLGVRPYDYHNGASIKKPDGTFYDYKSNTFAMLTFGQKSSTVASLGLFTEAATTHNAGEWVDVAYVFSWTDKTEVTARAYYDGSATPSVTYTMPCQGVDARPAYFRFQVNAGTNLSWDIDNLNLYIAYTTDDASALALAFGASNHGVLYTNTGAYVDPAAYDGNYYFKVNVDKALDKNGTTVYTLAEKPFADKQGKIWFPVSALEHVMGPVSPTAPTETVNGIVSIRMEDIHLAYDGYNSFYDSCGLVAISDKDTVFVEGASDESLLPVMQKFLFDHVDTSLEKVEAFSVEDGQYLSHPYIFANQDKFNSLRATWLDTNGSADPTLKSYIETRVNSAESVYKNYAVVENGAYSSLATNKGLGGGQSNIYEIPYVNDQGYDIGGRLNQSSSHTARLQDLAFGWQITRDDKYALLAYDYAIAMGSWEHWGPGHFLNCADAAAPFAIAYDWLYNAWVDLGLDVAKIEEIIFTHAIIPGYYSRSANTIPEGWMRCISGVLTKSGWGFTGTNNWNAVCSSGMVIASLALAGNTTSTANIYLDTDVNGVAFEKTAHIGEIGDHTGMSTYQDYAEWLINECLYGMAMKGLQQYVPDGSYIESSGYWSYGTNNFFEMVAALTTATEYNTGVSEDFGMLDAWGIDRTCYYAINTQSSDFKTFNYHDSSSSVQDTSWFNFYGNYTGKTDLANYRVNALATGKSGSATVQDILFYVKPDGEFETLALQYWWEGINGYVVRDSWESGAIYAGIMGDTNNLGHGQIDSGSFVYHNGGTVWFCDIGTENYNCYGFWASETRYRYYKMSAEGNNTLFLANRTSVPYGQAQNGFGYIVETGDNEYGAYTILDNTTVYGGYARSAYRGMLLTNDRRTLVIQDEAEFLTPETAYWVGHTEQDVILSVDGTVAYMTDGKTVIRVTIMDMNNCGARFEIEDCYTYHLDASYGMDELAQQYYELGTHEDNHDRSQYKKLTIALDGVMSVKLAVVIEEIAVGEICDVGYEWQDMANWDTATPTSDGRVAEERTAYHTGDASLVGNVNAAVAGANISFSTDIVNGSHAYIVGTTSDTGAGKITFASRASLTEYGFLGDRTVALEFDLGALGALPDGIRLSLAGAGVEILGVDLSELGNIAAGAMQRITFVIDGATKEYFVFFGDNLIDNGTYQNSSVEDLAFTVSTTACSLTAGGILLDNISIRVFGKDYTDLRTAINGGGIATWGDRLEKHGGSSSPVARLTVRSNEFDTPPVDILRSVTYAGGSTGFTFIDLYSWADVPEHLSDGATLEVFISNEFYPLLIDNTITVHTGGRKFYATSEKYMAFVDGDVIEYREGSVTVTFVTDSGSVTKEYTSSVPAVYDGTLPTVITERQTDNGYSYLVKDGWSLAAGGPALSATDMTVTSENCVFYQAEKAVEGAFVTVKGDAITVHTDPDTLFTAAIKGGYDRITLVSDILFDSSAVSHSWSGRVNLYLNGYSITYRTTVSSDHMYQNGATVNIYGPGKLVNEAPSANLFLATGGRITVRDVTIESTRSVTDHRGGIATFINCDITITKASTSAFGVRNRNNVNTEILPTVNIENCRINMPYASGSTQVFSVACNSVLSVKDTEVRVSSGCVLFALENTVIGSAPGYDYDAGFEKMQVKIGNLIHNCATYVTTKSNSPTAEPYPEMADKIGFVEGAQLKWEQVGSTIYDGCVAARQNESEFPYITASPENTVTVTWRVGSQTVSEVWLKGSVPNTDNPILQSLLSDIDEGKRYSFTLAPLERDTELVAAVVTDFPISVNLSLHTAFTVNIYLPITDGVTYKSFAVDGVELNGTECKMPDGRKAIKLSVDKENPATAAEAISLYVTFDDANTGISDAVVTLTLSIISYAETVLSGDYSEEAKGLMGNVLKYIKTAYDYVGNTLRPEYASIVSVMEKHYEYVTASVVKREEADLSSITHALTSAALYLENKPAFRFYIADGYKGSITLTYTTHADESLVSRTYTESSFMTENVDGRTVYYIDISMRAFDFAAPLAITVEGDGESVTATYSLAMYYHAVAKELGILTELANAIYAYSESARIYRDYSVINGLT